MAACADCHRQPPATLANPAPRGSCGDHTQFRAGCQPCQVAARTRRRTRTRARAYGRPDPIVHPGDTHDHIAHLREQHGMTMRQIAVAARVAHSSIKRIADGDSRYIWAVTAAAVLAVRPAAAPRPRDCVDSTGTARRLQALAAVGWGPADLAPALGVTEGDVRAYRRRYRPAIHAKTADAVAALYARLEGTAGPDQQARRTAMVRGWVPPLAWDDDTIDDPDAQPLACQADDARPVVDEVAIRRALNGERIKLTRLERHHAIHARGGMTVQQAAAALHLSYSRAKELAALPLPASAEEIAA